jgi:hypothetical protein
MRAGQAVRYGAEHELELSERAVPIWDGGCAVKHFRRPLDLSVNQCALENLNRNFGAFIDLNRI